MTHDDESYPLSNDDTEFVQELAAVEQALADLKYRYRDLQNALRQRDQLQKKQSEIELIQELAEINKKIQELSIDLESKLLTDADLQRILKRLYWEALKEEGVLREWFWQIVRFGGLGFILGWILKSSFDAWQYFFGFFWCCLGFILGWILKSRAG